MPFENVALIPASKTSLLTLFVHVSNPFAIVLLFYLFIKLQDLFFYFSNYFLLKGLGIHIGIKILIVAKIKAETYYQECSLYLGSDCYTTSHCNIGLNEKMTALIVKCRIPIKNVVSPSL
jgi:hypothetical protein